MNILLMISKNDRYGAQRIFLDQVSVLHKRGSNVIVAGRGTEGFVPEAVRAMGVEYFGTRLSGVKDLLSLRALVKRHAVDIIHTTLDRADYFGILLSLLTRKPVVSTMMVPRYHPGFKFADKIIVLSEKQRQLLLQRGVRDARIIVVRPGIDVDRFAAPDEGKRDAWKRKLGADRFSLVLCHVASLIPRKAHGVSLEIVAECKKQGQNPLLIIIGDPLSGDYYNRLSRDIAEHGLSDHVAFSGWTPDVPEIMSLCHFTMLPSENEALGIVLMEGMAAGTPIIAREGEGGAELVEEYGSGFLYRPEDGIAALAERIVSMHRDAARYKALSDRCREIASAKFSLERFGDNINRLYGSLLL